MDFLGQQVENQAHFDQKWRVFFHFGGHMCVLVRHVTNSVQFRPLYIHSFPLLAPHQLLEAGKLHLRFTDLSQITLTSDKLRWYRHQKGLLQRDVADYAGIDRSTYIGYEEAGRDYYPLEQMQRLAALYGVNVTALLDDYNLFLYHDQGKQIRRKREALHMTVPEYARHLGVNPGTLRKWESGKVRIFKRTWEKYFK